MKKILAFTLVFLLFGFTISAANTQTTDIEKGYISVNESEIKEIDPNQAEISIGIETYNLNVKKASEENKEIANNVYSAIKTILGKDDYIKTGNYLIHPQYIYTKDNKRVLDKYIVSNTVSVKTKNINLVSKIIDTATQKGATKIDNLNFSAVDYEQNCDAIMAELTKKAYNKANAIAKSINHQISGVKSINVSCNIENNPRPYYGGAMLMKATAENVESTPIESGKIKLYFNVDASFYVK